MRSEERGAFRISLPWFGIEMVMPEALRVGSLSCVTFEIYAYLTWATLGHERLIDAEVGAFLQGALPGLASRHHTRILELGLVSDEVHIVVELPHHVDVPRLLQGLKGASARIANRDGVAKQRPLRWAPGYHLRSLNPGTVERAREYVREQPRRHPQRAIPGFT